jgi:hypothetical protein
MTKELSLDLSNWQSKTPEQISRDLTSALVEQKDGSFAERLFSGTLLIEKEKLVDPTYGPLRLRNETSLDRLENMAVERIIKLAQETPDFIVWISPPSKNYTESRFIIYFPKKEGDSLQMDYITICSPHSLESCLFTAKQLLTFSSQNLPLIEDEDELRSTPIGVWVSPPYQNWLELMQDALPFPEIWEAIRKGKHIENVLEAQRVAQKLTEEFYPEIITSSGLEEIRTGAKLELKAQKYGFPLQLVGSCGMSNLAFLREMERLTPFTFLHSLPSISESGKYVKNCGNCGKPIEAVIPKGFRCPSCGGIYQGC